MFSHINESWEDLIFLRVNDWEGVNGYENFVSFAVDSNGIIIVFVLLIGCELNVNFLCYTWGNHSFLAVLDLKIRSSWRQNVQSLGSWGVINKSHSLSVSLQYFKACKLYYAWTCSKDSIRTNIIIHIYNTKFRLMVSWILFLSRALVLSVLVFARSLLWISMLILFGSFIVRVSTSSEDIWMLYY